MSEATVEEKEGFDGPTFQRVEEIAWTHLVERGGFEVRTTPLLVKGALRGWPALERWTFEHLAALRQPDGSEVVFRFQNGLVEQGVTKLPLDLPISSYIGELAQASRRGSIGDAGLLPVNRRRQIGPDDTFTLNWAYMRSFVPDKVYLAQWDILEQFPTMRQDFAIREVWPGWRWTWEFVFIGPARTVTGLHYDFPNNWFCQIRGAKEVILFAPDQRPYLCPSRKYDWGATLSDINIAQLDSQPREAAQFAQARGQYAYVESGDALFIPKGTWHAVVALEPSISLGVFGLTPAEIVLGGGPSEAKHLLHRLGLYRRNNCTCHQMPQ